MFLPCRGAVIGTMRKQVTTDKATQRRTISRNACGPSSETDSGACLGSSVPKDVADTTTKFVFTIFPVLNRTPTLPVQQTMLLEQLHHQIASCVDAPMLPGSTEVP